MYWSELNFTGLGVGGPVLIARTTLIRPDFRMSEYLGVGLCKFVKLQSLTGIL